MDQLTQTISPLVIDLVLAVIILFVAAIKAKAGLYHTVMSVVVIILALAIGLVGSNILTPTVKAIVWEKYKPTVEEKFDKKVEDALNKEISVRDVAMETWNKIISDFEIDKMTEALTIEDDDFDVTDSELVAKMKAFTLLKSELLVEKVVHLALFGVLAALGLLVMTIIKNILGKVADFSVVGWVNHLGGFVLGAVEAIVILMVIIRFASLLNIKFFTDISEGTVLLNWFIGGDIQGSINALQNMTLQDLKNIRLEDLTTVDMNDVGNQIKDLVNNIDTTALPDQVNDAINNIDTQEITDITKDVINSVTDSTSQTVTDAAQGVKDGVTDAARDAAQNAAQSVVNGILDAVKGN